MAARVNKTFVILLTASLLVVFGAVATAGYFALSNRGLKNIARGDTAYEAGDYYDASLYYGRAVARETTNIEWLEKWDDAMLRSTPETRAEYEKFYSQHNTVLQNLAFLNDRDIDHQIGYIKTRDKVIRQTSRSVTSLDRIIDAVEDSVKYIDRDEPKLAKLYRYRGIALVDRMSSEVLDLEQRTLALEDLNNAIAFDPNDNKARLAVARWHLAEKARFSRNGQADLAHLAYNDGLQVINDFLVEDPDNPAGLLLRFQTLYFEQSKRAVAPQDVAQLHKRFLVEYKKCITAIAKADPEILEPTAIEQLLAITGLVRDADLEPILTILNEMIDSNPNELRLLSVKGRIFLQLRKFDEEIGRASCRERV